jgi:hypothetical protein
MLGSVEVLVLSLILPALGLLALYWVIRLAVRHGVIDAHHRTKDAGGTLA